YRRNTISDGDGKEIKIDFNGKRFDLRRLGISFHPLESPDGVKIEYKDNEGGWVELYDSPSIGASVYINIKRGEEYITSIYGLKITFFCNASFSLYGIFMFADYARAYEGPFLTNTGGSLYGDLNLLGLKNAASLATDANGKLIAGTQPS